MSREECCKFETNVGPFCTNFLGRKVKGQKGKWGEGQNDRREIFKGKEKSLIVTFEKGQTGRRAESRCYQKNKNYLTDVPIMFVK